MFSRLLIALLAAASLLSAQDEPCPYLRVEHVPQDIRVGPTVPCAGADVSFGGVEIGTGHGQCPLFAVIYPDHDRAVPSTKRTKVEVVGTTPIVLLKFECRRTYFLLFPTGWYCAHLSSETIATRQLLREVPCNDSADA